MTREEYDRLPDATHPPHPDYRLPEFDVSSEIDFDQARKITYHRARLWIREDERASDIESSPKKYVQIMMTLDRDIVKSYSVDMLADLLKYELVKAFLQSVK